MLNKPVLALTKDRTKKASTNYYCGDPTYWFDSKYFVERGIYSTSFDFFVNWENESICNEIWIKRISTSDNIQEYDKDELLSLISRCDGRDESNRLFAFMKYHNLTQKYMLFRDVPEYVWNNGEEQIVELNMSQLNENAISYYSVKEIQEKIKALRRVAVSIGAGGLRYSTSSLEGYLSKTSYFWPGDVDALLYNKSYAVMAILEFKKHTASSLIPFKEQGIANYLKKDILKYKSLALLRDKFSTNFFVIYYPIPRDLDYVIIEKIEGNSNNLYASERYELKLPCRYKKDSMIEFTKEFLTKVMRKK